MRIGAESKDPDGMSSAMQPQGVLSILLRENALMLHLRCKHSRDAKFPRLRSGFRLAAQTPPKRLNFDCAPFIADKKRDWRRFAQDDRREAARFSTVGPSTLTSL